MSGCITSLWDGSPAWLQPGFCPSLYADGLWTPRGLHIGENDEILLVDRNKARVVRLDDGGTNIVPVASFQGLNHGIELAGEYLYASTPTSVYRWPYRTGQMAMGTSDDAQEVIMGMGGTASNELGAPGGHKTRTLAFDDDGRWLYVSIGSNGNVDRDSYRSRIRRFDIASWDGARPMKFNEGEVFADGLRNEVGMAFDSHGDLWGVENGADRLNRQDIGGDIHNDNPSEELNRFPESRAGESWGYPQCWSEYCLPAENGGSGTKGANTPWAWPSFIRSGYTDEWCRENTNPSAMSMPAHSAPLGMTFYKWRDLSREEYAESGCAGGFPRSMDKYAFIAFHGSWNRNPPTGYKVVFVPFDGGGNPTALPIDLFRHGGEGAKWPNSFRPVDVQFDRCGRLYVTDDGTGSVIRITYAGGYRDEFVPIETDVDDGASCSPFQSPIGSEATSPLATVPANDPSPRPMDSMQEQPTGSPAGSPAEKANEPSQKSWTLKPANECCSQSNDGYSIGLSLLSSPSGRAMFSCIFSMCVMFILWR